MKTKRQRKLWGRHAVTLGALALLGLSGYELWIRLEDFRAWMKGIKHLSEELGEPFLKIIRIIFEEPDMRKLGLKLLFLVFACLFSLICLLRRDRARGAWVILAADVCLVACGVLLGLFTLRIMDWSQTWKLLPLLLIAFGCLANLADRWRRRRRRVRHHEK